MPSNSECRDLGITVAAASHIIGNVAKAHQWADIILRCFASKVLVSAFIVYVRPIVEHNSVVWSPCLKRDTDLIEKVQRRLTKRLYGLKSECRDLDTYADRLVKLGLHSLELRRLHLDLVLCYTIDFGVINVSFNDFFLIRYAIKNNGSCV